MIFLCVTSSLFGSTEAKAFLNAAHQEQFISKAEIETSLLAEVEGSLGEGSASSRLKRLEVALTPMYAALPKNENGYLGHATVRYALHRLFVQRHGWMVNGLHHGSGHRNSTSTPLLLKEQVPAYVQDLFEERLGGRGFGLHELAVLAATLEHLVHNEVVNRLAAAFKLHGFLPTSTMSQTDVDNVLDSYMMAYILTEDLSNITLEDAMELRGEMPETFAAWPATLEFMRDLRRNIVETEGSAEQKASKIFDFGSLRESQKGLASCSGPFKTTNVARSKALYFR
jgi:hypothetical protein